MLENPYYLEHQGGPIWAPDGKSLLVWRTYLDRGPILSIITPDGSFVRDFASVELAGGWSYSPDGRSILYVTDVQGSQELGRCPSAGTAACPAMILGVNDDSISALPFQPEAATWQRRP
jgi:Tol biopolymer transport system component